ncbi:hypothetical protein [Novosphingobium sp. fls2-241-R2A-195]|jgi:hypothetical protein|uniref:hypothetical protein n=1 Tax=Novosphingobium sp. fls2-241-R2A-195 TaxID=3040296 RepID=UPI002550A768|nr:hypothetical protein [Novosphingobium sp. fls2-241-R2A-195]
MRASAFAETRHSDLANRPVGFAPIVVEQRLIVIARKLPFVQVGLARLTMEKLPIGKRP